MTNEQQRARATKTTNVYVAAAKADHVKIPVTTFS
jgi:hypothetical protein